MTHAGTKTKLYTRYPASHIALYNGVTVLHFLLGGAGIMLGYGPSWLAYLFGALYLAFAFVEMYLVMPLKVCPNCVYYGMKDAICISGLNMVSAKIGIWSRLKSPEKGISRTSPSVPRGYSATTICTSLPWFSP